MKFAQQRRFTPEQEAEICRLYATGQHSQHALARMNGCSQGTIARMLKAKPEMNVATLQRRVAELEAKLATARLDGVREGMEKVAEWHDNDSARAKKRDEINLHRTYAATIRAALQGGKDE